MFKKLSQIQTYKQYLSYLEKLNEKRNEYKEAYEREARNFYSNLKVVLNPTKLLNNSRKNDNIQESTQNIWRNYNVDNLNYIEYNKYEEYIKKLTSFVDPIIDENLTQTNKYWLNLLTKILNEKTDAKWKVVNISAKIAEPYAREDSTQTQNYICLINEKTDLSSINLKQLETQYQLYNLNTLNPDYRMDNIVLLSENKDLKDLIIYDRRTLNNNFIKHTKTYNKLIGDYVILHKLPSTRRYKFIETEVYNDLWKKVLARAQDFENSLTLNNEEQGAELE